jgi:dTDP-4-amino-4,6-dideoxygalactose transaminase
VRQGGRGVTRPTGESWAVPFMRPAVPPYEAIADGVREALATGCLTKGPQLAAFEREAAAAVGTGHVVGVSSCTTGLMLVLKAIADLAAGCHAADGRRPGCPAHSDPIAASQKTEVILPSFIFLAAPAAVQWAGLTPVFVDVDPRSYTLAPAAVGEALSSRTTAVLGCHTFGCPCDVDGLARVASEAGVPLVIDAAHGLGSEIAGRQVGQGCLAQVFSLSPTKLVVAGEGGLVATDCLCLAEAITVAREYGNDGSYGSARAGVNGRLPELSAALGRASLAQLPETAASRRQAAAAYRKGLLGVPGIEFQEIPAGAQTSWKDFCIGVDQAEAGLSRDALRHALAEASIDTRAYFSPACHQMEAYAGCARGPLPVTEQLADSLMALPMGSHVTPGVATQVAGEIHRILEQARQPVSS